VPVVAFPPPTPFTDQFTWVFAVPVTVVEKDCVALARTFAVVGATLTVICGGGVVFDLVTPEQSTRTRISTSNRPMSSGRVRFSLCFDLDPRRRRAYPRGLLPY